MSRSFFLIVLSFILLCSCGAKQSRVLPEEILIGDCFVFNSEDLFDFRLVLLKKEIVDGDFEFSFVPIQLNRQNKKEFQFGHVFIQKYPDATIMQNVSGFSVFIVRGIKELEKVLSLLNKEGVVLFQDKYCNVTGGTIALTLSEFKRTLGNWKLIFGRNSELTTIKDIALQIEE